MEGNIDYSGIAFMIWVVLLPLTLIFKGLFGTTKKERERRKLAKQIERREHEMKRRERRMNKEDREESEWERLELAKDRMAIEDGADASSGRRQKTTILAAIFGGIVGGS